jgi:Fe-Mn family superoxide dismutase
MKINSMKKREQSGLITGRRSFMRMLFGGAAGAALAPVLFSCESNKSGTAKKVQQKVTAALSAAGFAHSSGKASGSYPYELPPLPYDFNALEPAIFERTMQVHHGKHHSGYTKKLNAALENYPDLQKKTIVDLLSNLDNLPAEVQTAVRNNGGGYFNHALFWHMMTPNGGGTPKGDLVDAITRDFGSFESFKNKFSTAAKTLFGSGWTWLVVNPAGQLEIQQTPNQNTPLENGDKPVLGLDVWEHAYYLQYENRRAEYVDNFWSVVNWKQCGINFKA